MEKDDQRKVEEMTRITLRPLASPLPLAFFAFGVGSILHSAFQFGVVPPDESRNMALIFGGITFPFPDRSRTARIFIGFHREHGLRGSGGSL